MSIQHLNEVLADPEMKASLEKRFAKKVKVAGANDCWLWIAKSVANYGYGRMTAGRGRYLRAHQVAYALKNGPIAAGLVIRHTCDTPACCNPLHLVSGTQTDNVRDAKIRGRATTPPHHSKDQHYNVKLTTEQAIQIANSAETLEVCASRFGVSSKTVWRIRKGIRWKE